MVETLLFFTISFLIGLLIGIERERSHAEGLTVIGVRTFMLFSILGTLAATLNQLPLTMAISLFVFGIILLSYVRSIIKGEADNSNGITTEISAAIIYCLGYLIPTAALVAITISAIVLLILYERKRLHKLARKKFKPHEIEAAIILIIFALGILPILPSHTIDPWGLFNPRNFGVLIATIAAIQFGGYVAIRLFGERFGMAAMGFSGGLVSSTAFFATLPSTLRSHPKFSLAIIASAMLATVAMLVDIMTIVFVASPTLLFFIIKPMLVMIIVGMTFTIILLHYQTIKRQASPALSNPLNLYSVLGTSLFLGATLILIAIAKRYIGTKGVLLISFLAGLFEIHGISLATALLYLGNLLKINAAASALWMAILASFVSKFFLLWSLTPRRFALQTSLLLFGILASGGFVLWLTI
jgi:uncharacterized membrane protein (DUF4010 family)